MTETATHPTEEELSAFNLGQLPSEESEKIETHIAECDRCCETLLGLSKEDTFLALLKESDKTGIEQTMGVGLDSSTEIPEPLTKLVRYEVTNLVGKGGMGRVYQARHRMMDRAVALKVINPEWVRNQEVIDRFHREVKTAASLSHPHIVTAYDAEQAGDLHFLVMEFVDGIDLAQTVKKRGPLPVKEACRYIQKAAEGLQYAHECGMVHRDIKPHNLMVTKEDAIKILDFGLASLVPQSSPDEPITEDADGNLTFAGTIMGTPDFISPEQAQDARTVDGRSDIYSLGMTLYYLLAGRVPFEQGSAMEKLKQHADAEPTPLDSLRDDIPPRLLPVISQMIAKDPDERFQSPAEVALALEPFMSPAEQTQQVLSDETSTIDGIGGNIPDPLTAKGDRHWSPLVWWVLLGCLVAGLALAYFVLSFGTTVTILFIFSVLILQKIQELITNKKQNNHNLSSGDSWLLLVSELLGLISLLPLAMLGFEWANWNEAMSYEAEQRMWIYGLTALGLSTIGGVTYGVFKAKLLYPSVPVKPVVAFTFLTIIATWCFVFAVTQESVADKLTRLKTPEQAHWPANLTPKNNIRIGWYNVAGEALGGNTAAICDLNDCRIALLGQDISDNATTIDSSFLTVSGPRDIKRSVYSGELNKGEPYFQSGYSNGVAKCRFYNFRFDLTDKIIRYGKVQHVWNDPSSPGLLILVDTVSGKITTQTMKPQNERGSVSGLYLLGTTENVKSDSAHQSKLDMANTDFPTLQIMGVDDQSTKLGSNVKKTWKLQGRRLNSVTARILHISEGQRRTAYQTSLRFDESSESMKHGQLVLNSQDHPDDQVALSLDLSFGNEHDKSTSEPVLFAKGFGRSTVSRETKWEGQHIGADEEAYLSTLVRYPPKAEDSIIHRMNDLGSMIEASKQGAEFLLITLLWESVKESRAIESPDLSDTVKANKPAISGSKLELSEDVAHNHIQHRGIDVVDFEVELYQAISQAAGIPNEQWESVANGMSPEVIEGTPLSKFLLMNLSDYDSSAERSFAPNAFGVLTKGPPKPLELHKAMAPSQPDGYVSLIQPEYITRALVDYDRDRKIFTGTVWFEAPNLYAGKVDFNMYYKAVSNVVSQLKVDEFELPELGVKLVLGSKLWQKKQQPGKDQILMDLKIDTPLEEVRTAIRDYYVDKYPIFAASVNQRSKMASDLSRLSKQEFRRQIGELAIASPVSEVINSFPGMPYLTFTEKTQLSNTELLETKINLYRIDDNSCRIVCVHKRRASNANEEPARSKPITANELRQLIMNVQSEYLSSNTLDHERIQGIWQVTYSEDNGRIAPQESLINLRFVIDEQTLTTEIGGRKRISMYKLSSTSSPKAIDLTEEGRTKLGIYDLVGDTLRFCIAESGEDRPTAFDSQPESANDIIIMLKRVHSEIVPAAHSTEVPSVSDHELLQGFWEATSRVVNGVEIERDWNKHSLTTHFFGHDIDWGIGGEEDLGDAKYQLDTTADPKQIDIRSENGNIIRAIYELRSDTLRICISNSKSDKRPTSFESTPDSNTTVTTLKLLEAPVLFERKCIQDTWRVQTQVVAGVVSTEAELKLNPTLYTFGEQRLLIENGEQEQEVSYRFIDYLSVPKTINLIEDQGNMIRGICDFKGRTMKLCLQDPDSQERPTAFEASAELKTTLLTLNRVPPPVSDFQRIQGTWQLISSLENQVVSKYPIGNTGPPTYIFQGSNLIKNDGSANLETSFYLNHHFNEIFLIDEDWKITLGRYTIQGDTLRLRLSKTDYLPSSTQANPDSKSTLLTFQKISDDQHGLANANTYSSLPLVQVLSDAKGLTAERVKIIGIFQISDHESGVRSYRISTAQEKLPPPPNQEGYSTHEMSFDLTLDEENFPNLGALHNKRVIVTGPIYFFPGDESQPSEAIFMPQEIREYKVGPTSSQSSTMRSPTANIVRHFESTGVTSVIQKDAG